MTVLQLDHVHDPTSNSIGALLAHFAAVEVYYQGQTFGAEARLDPEEPASREAALNLGEPARALIRGRELGHYVAALAAGRAFTLRELAARDDAWLELRVPFWRGQEANHHFQWFHVMEDEINHRGQIRWLRKHLPEL